MDGVAVTLNVHSSRCPLHLCLELLHDRCGGRGVVRLGVGDDIRLLESSGEGRKSEDCCGQEVSYQ